MDVQQLIGEVARRHNVLVDPTDPVFVTVTLNELLLAEYVRRVEAAVVGVEAQAAAAAERRVEVVRSAATQLVAEAARQMSEQVKAAGLNLRAQVEQVVRDTLAASRASAAEAARHRRASRWAAALALACAGLGVLLAGSIWLRS